MLGVFKDSLARKLKIGNKLSLEIVVKITSMYVNIKFLLF